MPPATGQMVKLPKSSELVMLSGLLTFGWTAIGHGATSTTLDILPNDIMGPPEKVEVGVLKPMVPSKPVAAGAPASGNPLWSVPLSVLTATQERPIFSISRRPPPRAVAGPRIEPVADPVPPAVIEPPPLSLIGAVVGDRDAIAVFLDRSTQAVVRLRAGEAHAGWLLSSVLGRQVTLTRDDRTEVLVLQRSDGSAGPRAVPGMPPPTQVLGTGGPSPPFVPRSTPKNGESDGL
jgi:general secretion pathway protein N